MLSFKHVSKIDYSAFIQMAQWDNDDKIKYLLRPNFSEGELKDCDAESSIISYNKNPFKFIYLMYHEDIPIGYVNINYNFEDLVRKDIESGFIAICIGDENYRNKGYGKNAIEFVEECAKQKQVYHIELGVFEYNLPALNLYKKCGYELARTDKNFVYYDNKWHDGYRLEKYL